MAENDFEKTEAPTARRRQESREEGQVVRSADLTATLMLLAAIVLLHFMGMKVMAGLRTMLEVMLSSSMASNVTRADDVEALVLYSGRVLAGAIGPLVLCITAVGLLATVGQVGLMITTKPLAFNLAKLSPLRGLKNLFDTRSVFRLVMSLAKTAVVVAIALAAIAQDMPLILMLPELELAPLFAAACQLVYALALKLAATLLVLALIDYAFQRWRHEHDLRMTKQEIKEEMRRMEGDPLIKQRRSRVARQLAMQRLGMAVPKADVVVTNPTHYAVALRYDPARMGAPRVVAKGADLMAMRIRQLAQASGVPLVERKTLAQGLYRGVDVGQEVPPEFYNAVAEILAYVYRLGGRKIA